MERKQKDIIEETVNSTNFVDKLYEVSMQKPVNWAEMKADEFQTIGIEDMKYHEQRAQMKRNTPSNNSQQSTPRSSKKNSPS